MEDTHLQPESSAQSSHGALSVRERGQGCLFHMQSLQSEQEMNNFVLCDNFFSLCRPALLVFFLQKSALCQKKRDLFLYNLLALWCCTGEESFPS